MSDIDNILEKAHRARLIPTIADVRKEERLVSILLATLAVVQPFAKQLLGQCGVRMGKKSKLLSYTEVIFPSSDENNTRKDEDRPDGLLILSTGKSQWKAFVEAKIDNVEIDEEQVERYAKIAKANGIDAVITLSNQLTPLPTHTPYSISKVLNKHVDLFHISWINVRTQASMILKDKEEISSEQAYILGEMVHYFKHPKSGVKGFEQMNKEWKSLVAGMIHGDKFSKSSLEIQNTVSSWHQEERDICLLLSRKIGKHVDIILPSKYKKNPELRFREACDSLIAKHELRSRFNVPNAASNIEITVNLEGRSISCSMKLDAPGDRKKASARINWLLRQLRDVDGNNVIVRAFWPGKTPPTRAPLSEIRKDTKCLEVERPRATPTSFEVRMNKDLVGGFSKPKNFIKDLEEFVPQFYKQIGEHLRRWIPSPPPIDKRDPIQESTAPNTTEESSGHNSPPSEISQSNEPHEPNNSNTSSTEHPQRMV